MAKPRNIATIPLAHYDNPGTPFQVKTGSAFGVLTEDRDGRRRVIDADGNDLSGRLIDADLNRWIAGGEFPHGATLLPGADKPAPKRVRDDVWFMAFNRAAYVIGGAAITAALLDHGSVNYLLFAGAVVLMACFIRRKHIEG